MTETRSQSIEVDGQISVGGSCTFCARWQAHEHDGDVKITYSVQK